MSYSLELTDRRALVTGGTKGVGAAVVAALRDAGAKVMTTARSVPLESLEGVDVVAADLSTPEGCTPLPMRFSSGLAESTSSSIT